MDETLDPRMAVALFRYEAIAAYLAADPPRGQRRPLLAQLAARTWIDPLGRPPSAPLAPPLPMRFRHTLLHMPLTARG